jgi:hypothetical protein
MTQAALAVLDNLESDKGRPTGRSFFGAASCPGISRTAGLPENLPRRWPAGKEGIIIELVNWVE